MIVRAKLEVIIQIKYHDNKFEIFLKNTAPIIYDFTPIIISTPIYYMTI